MNQNGQCRFVADGAGGAVPDVDLPLTTGEVHRSITPVMPEQEVTPGGIAVTFAANNLAPVSASPATSSRFSHRAPRRGSSTSLRSPTRACGRSNGRTFRALRTTTPTPRQYLDPEVRELGLDLTRTGR
ncbi:MAG: hypothetical protein M0P22_03265 [Methanoculleus sp.]|nr:hypothetical protein [Methanoculleus sp.]